MAWWSRHTHTEKTQEKKTTIREETHDRHELDHHTFTRWLHSHAGTHTPVDSISNNTTVMAPPLDRRGLGFRLYTPVATDSVPGGGAEPGRRGGSRAPKAERGRKIRARNGWQERERAWGASCAALYTARRNVYIYIYDRVCTAGLKVRPCCVCTMGEEEDWGGNGERILCVCVAGLMHTHIGVG